MKAGMPNYKISILVSLGCGMFCKRMGPLDTEIRQHIPIVAQLGDIPDHLRNLRVFTAIKTVKKGYESAMNLGEPVKGLLFDVLLAEVHSHELLTVSLSYPCNYNFNEYFVYLLKYAYTIKIM